MLAFLFVFLSITALSYDRPPARHLVFLNQLRSSSSSPQQVHISLVGEDKIRVSWITKSESAATLKYGTSPGDYPFSANGDMTSYRYMLYKSGQIHDVVIGPLKPNTTYYYQCGSSDTEFTVETPPSELPIKFVVVGDLGQTGWTNSTLQQIAKSNYDILLLPGDLSYADFVQPLWDSFGRLVEPLASQRPWMVTQGNHEIERIPLFHNTPFTSYNSRWRMPFEESGSTSNLYYSFNTAGVHVVMLGSYTDFEPNSEQYKWLEQDLKNIDRKITPWIVVVIHAPWYNSNTAHQGENESVEMKKAMEELLYEARVDIVFAGHVHAYERFTHVFNGKANNCGPVHITIGDGGNREGLASKFMEPKPEISVFREASFGHGQLEVMNESHALWTWHRNENDQPFASDSIWFTSLSSNPSCKLNS
ncbi:probable purple acid phosphatase 20 [Pistacia vera]|uniref:probable purple acid phosphatase 20 n=1 Tax=Pistacia vera TaxID=55513 RepID=UPI0012635A19|nr:probable purple acid phosphatase 20 [Pistacia vera]